MVDTKTGALDCSRAPVFILNQKPKYVLIAARS